MAVECPPTESVSGAADSVDLFLVRRRRLELLRQRVETIRSNGLAFYRPHEKQTAFHRAGATTRRRMVRTGNRWGKSTCGVAEDLAWAKNERTWLPENDPYRRAGIPQRPIKGLVITTDWETVDDVFTGNRGTQGKFWQLAPVGFIKQGLRNHSGSIDTLEFANGSLIKFATVKSYMTNPQGMESKDWDFVHVDEPCPEGMFKAAARGLMDRGGSAWFTLTPLREFWINDYFFPEDTGGRGRDDVWAINGSTTDNPFLSPEAIAEFESLLSEDEKQCRLHGIPLHLSGLVYKEFSWDRHVLKAVPSGWDNYLSPPANWSIYVFIDPHPQTPHAVLFCAVSPFGSRFYYSDLFQRSSIKDLCDSIRERLNGRAPIDIRLDPLGYVNDPITETNMADEFLKHGVLVEKATKAREHGIIQVKAALASGKKDGEFQQIYFTPECRRSLWEIQRYCWDEKENKPVDKDDHMMENLYRCELTQRGWVDMRSTPNTSSEEVINATELELEEYSLDL